jgi:uncharacterized protein (DUF934 family)
MPSRLIRGGHVADDDFVLLALAEGEDAARVALPAGPLIVPLALWNARREELLARPAPVGVRLGPADDPDALRDDLPRLALVAIDFPKFTDGRGYSLAYRLRRRLGFKGELRAIGDVQRDQLFYLSRSGFDAFVLKEGLDAQAALASLGDFAATYQGAGDGRVPRYRAGPAR